MQYRPTCLHIHNETCTRDDNLITRMRQTVHVHFANFICINCRPLRTVSDVQPESIKEKNLISYLNLSFCMRTRQPCTTRLPVPWVRTIEDVEVLTLVKCWPVPRELNRWWMLGRLLTLVGLGGPFVVQWGFRPLPCTSPGTCRLWRSFRGPMGLPSPSLHCFGQCWGRDTDCPSYFTLECLITYDSDLDFYFIFLLTRNICDNLSMCAVLSDW